MINLTTYQIELIGIAATIIILISFMFKDEIVIRKVNAVGAFMLVIYGLLINALSVWLLNAILIVIHIIKLIKYKKEKEND